MLSVGKFTIILSSAIFIILIGCSVQSISADHLESGTGIYEEFSEVNLVTTKDSNYQVYLQAVIRSGDGQLINVTESAGNAAFIPHPITDHVFDTLMGEKEIITIDNIKYEKVQYIYSPTFYHRFMALYPIFSEYYDVEFKITSESREVMYEHKEYSIWKIHYCATFEGHGFSCIPIFQDLVPTMTLEQPDTVTQQWTILRELDR